MGILSKIITAVKGHATEAGEAIVDANALTILDQEIRDADSEIRKSRDNLASVMAKRQLTADKLAGKIAELEGDISTDEGLVKEYDSSIESLRKSIAEADDRIKRMKVKVDVVKAREHVIRASQAASQANVGANSKVGSALESLERLQQRQAEQQAKLKAADQLAKEGTDAGLEDKLKAAGIVSGGASAQDVLARFRKPQ